MPDDNKQLIERLRGMIGLLRVGDQLPNHADDLQEVIDLIESLEQVAKTEAEKNTALRAVLEALLSDGAKNAAGGAWPRGGENVNDITIGRVIKAALQHAQEQEEK